MRSHRHGGHLSAAFLISLGLFGGACASGVPSDLAGEGYGYEDVTLQDGSSATFSRCEDRMEKGGYCLSLRYVSFRDDGGEPILSANTAEDNVEAINEIFDQCGIQFQVDSFASVDPADRDLNFNTSTSDELNEIRRAFRDPKSLLVVTTGDWAGDLGEGSANAWTMMPGSAPYGAILEESVGNYPNIIAHELGHYLGLDHLKDENSLMNPVIYSYSEDLSEEECSIARQSIDSYWRQMVR